MTQQTREQLMDSFKSLFVNIENRVHQFDQPGDAVGWAIDYSATARVLEFEEYQGYKHPIVFDGVGTILYLKLRLDDSGTICDLMGYNKDNQGVYHISEFNWDKEQGELPYDRMKLMVMIYAFCKNKVGLHHTYFLGKPYINVSEFYNGEVHSHIDNLGFDKHPKETYTDRFHLNLNLGKLGSLMQTPIVERLGDVNKFYYEGMSDDKTRERYDLYQHRDVAIERREESSYIHYLLNGKIWITYEVTNDKEVSSEVLFNVVWLISMVMYKNNMYFSQQLHDAFISNTKDLNLSLMNKGGVVGVVKLKHIETRKELTNGV